MYVASLRLRLMQAALLENCPKLGRHAIPCLNSDSIMFSESDLCVSYDCEDIAMPRTRPGHQCQGLFPSPFTCIDGRVAHLRDRMPHLISQIGNDRDSAAHNSNIGVLECILEGF